MLTCHDPQIRPDALLNGFITANIARSVLLALDLDTSGILIFGVKILAHGLIRALHEGSTGKVLR